MVATVPQAVDGPDFLCIGMQKAGTKWLYDSLSRCPGFWMPPIKEMHFFDRNFLEKDLRERIDAKCVASSLEVVANGGAGSASRIAPGAISTTPEQDVEFARNWLRLAANGYHARDYRALFTAKREAISGDVTPAYSALDVPDIRIIRDAVPKARIVLMIRDPVGRAWSSFNMYVRTRLLPPEKRFSPDGMSVVAEATTLEALSDFMATPANRARSFPSVSYRRWAAAFGAKQMHVIFFDDVIKRPVEVIEETCAYLGVSLANPPLPAPNVKQNSLKNAIGEEHRDYLKRYFRDEYSALRRLFPQHTTGWQSELSSSG